MGWWVDGWEQSALQPAWRVHRPSTRAHALVPHLLHHTHLPSFPSPKCSGQGWLVVEDGCVGCGASLQERRRSSAQRRRSAFCNQSLTPPLHLQVRLDIVVARGQVDTVVRIVSATAHTGTESGVRSVIVTG